MFVKICYHVGALGTLPPSAFETELRESIVREAGGQAFTLTFEARPGFGMVPIDEQVQVGDGHRATCSDWLDTIGNQLIPESFASVRKRY